MNKENKIMYEEMNGVAETTEGNNVMTFEQMNAVLSQMVFLQTGTNKQLGIITQSVTSMRNDISGLTDRMDQIESNEEITTEQTKKIINTAQTRVNTILGEDEFEHQKYFRSFVGRIYSDARKYAGLASSISTTKKRDYQRIIDFLEAWTPTGGISRLKRIIDDKAKAKKKAQIEGYI